MGRTGEYAYGKHRRENHHIMLCRSRRIRSNDEHSDRQGEERCTADDWLYCNAQTTGNAVKDHKALRVGPGAANERGPAVAM
jgi:hypothetical protein